MRAAFALLALIFVTRTATAQPAVTIPDTVITATRIPTPVTDIPAGVTVIDRQTIEDSGATTLGEVLATVPGLHVSPSGGPGGQSSVFLRGTNSGHVLVLRDGMPINDNSDPSDAFNFGIDSLSDIERIEVIRGPMAALYGSGAIGGVINLISRRGTAGAPLLQMDLSGGYPATIQGSAQASGVQGPIDYALTLESQSRRGFDSTPRRMTSIYTGTPQGFRDRIATANLGYTPIEGTRLSLFLRGSETLFGFNTLGSPTFDDANSFGTVSSLLGRIGVTSKLFNGVYETGMFLGRLQDDRRYLEQLDLADPNLQAEDDRYHAYRTDLQWNNTVHLNEMVPSTLLTHSDLTFGYEHTVDTINVRVNESFAGSPFTQSARASMITDAAYTGISTTVWKRVIVTGQVRQDWVISNTPTTWRLGSVILVPEIGTSFKAAYGTAFRARRVVELHGVDSFGTVGNPGLKPESAQGLGGGVDHDRSGSRTCRCSYIRCNVFQSAGERSDRWRVHPDRHLGQCRFRAHPGCGDGIHAAFGNMADTACELYLHRCHIRRPTRFGGLRVVASATPRCLGRCDRDADTATAHRLHGHLHRAIA